MSCLGQARFCTTELRLDHPALWRTPPSGPSWHNDPPLAPLQVPRVYNTRILANALVRYGMLEAQPIPSANTPIVKFKEHGSYALDCDININDLGGWWVRVDYH